MRTRTRLPAPRGAALIEFVLVAPLFLLLLLGAIDWGWYFVLRETVVNATREGARVASVQEVPATQSQAAATAAVRDYLTRINAAGVQVQSPVVGFTPISVPGVPTPVCGVSVRLVAYPSAAISGVSWTLVPSTLTVETVMRVEIQSPTPPGC
jgi:Flp pilus assembly protein TadG